MTKLSPASIANAHVSIGDITNIFSKVGAAAAFTVDNNDVLRHWVVLSVALQLGNAASG